MAQTQTAAAPAKADLRRNRWLALALTPSLGAIRSRKLVEHFGGIDAVFNASLTELEAAGLRAEAAQSIALGKSFETAEEELMRAASGGAEILTFDDPAYPPNLRNIYDPPVALYVKGSMEALSAPGVAIVGTRHPTPYGIGMSQRLACDLASRGLVIFSGMARGVDTCAHKGALEGKGRTVAVWGTGVDVAYPRENKKLAEQIVANGGAVVSEFAMGTFAAPQNFPIRNRIISGLAIGVLVVEAGEYSGTRITARNALEQSRDVYAVPGNVTNRQSWGPNTLIKQGAKLVATWEDVWEEMPPQVKAALQDREPRESSAPETASLFGGDEKLSPHERRIYKLLRADAATQLDQIIEQLEPEVSSSEVFAALFELELSGKVKQLPGKNYVRSF
jgi:DNA processing protein